MDAGTDWVVSQGRYALDFDGINDSVNSQLSLDNSVGFSISLWHRFDAYTSSFPVPLKLAVSGSGGFPFFLFWATAPGYNGLNLGSGDFFPRLRSNTSVNAGSWQHIGIVCNGNGTNAAHYTLYLDGVVVPLVMSAPYAPVDNVTQIGTTGGAGTFFDGLIDDIRVYNCALSSNQTRLLALSRGIAYEQAPRRRSSSAVQFNRRRRLLIGASS
jgi:hypothetical protein